MVTNKHFCLKVCFIAVLMVSILYLLPFTYMLSRSPSWKFPERKTRPIASTAPPWRMVEPGKFPWAEREKFYHNTLDLDYLHPEDFAKEPQLRGNASRRQVVRAKIIRAERSYKKKQFKGYEVVVKKETLPNLFAADFQCPYSKELVGGDKGKWICGFELFRVEPKPPECVVWVFTAHQNAPVNFEEAWLNQTECYVSKFEYQNKLSKIVSKVFPGGTNRLEGNPRVKLGTLSSLTILPLRSLLKDNEEGWLDVMVLDIGDSVYGVLNNLISDFSIQVLPWAQLVVSFPVASRSQQKEFVEMFKKMEEQRLRPFHVVVDGDELKYSFLNLRGKHLLLVGEDD